MTNYTKHAPLTDKSGTPGGDTAFDLRLARALQGQKEATLPAGFAARLEARRKTRETMGTQGFSFANVAFLPKSMFGRTGLATGFFAAGLMLGVFMPGLMPVSSSSSAALSAATTDAQTLTDYMGYSEGDLL